MARERLPIDEAVNTLSDPPFGTLLSQIESVRGVPFLKLEEHDDILVHPTMGPFKREALRRHSYNLGKAQRRFYLRCYPEEQKRTGWKKQVIGAAVGRVNPRAGTTVFYLSKNISYTRFHSALEHTRGIIGLCDWSYRGASIYVPDVLADEVEAMLKHRGFKIRRKVRIK